MRARTNINLKERKTLSLGEFKGVDFSSSPIDVHNTRASDMVNLINKYGVNCKRNGWCEIFRIEDANREGQMINGVFKYKEYFIVHAGVRFYEVKKSGGEYAYRDITEVGSFEASRVDPTRIVSRRSEAYLLKERLYIIGAGDYLVYGTWDKGKTYELRRVQDDEDTYIPTTTININCDTESENDIRGVLDEPNLLCSRRINSLVGSDANSTWTLDAPIKQGSKVEVKLEVYDDHGSIDEYKYVNSLDGEGYGDELYHEGKSVGQVFFDEGQIRLDVDTKSVSNMDNLFVTFTPLIDDPLYRIEKYTGWVNRTDNVNFKPLNLGQEIKEGEVVTIRIAYAKYASSTKQAITNYYVVLRNDKEGEPNSLYVREGNDAVTKVGEKAGEIKDGRNIWFNIITQDTDNSLRINLSNNITVKYIPKDDDKEEDEEKEEELTADVINNGRFGTLFGTYGHTDRLFVAGDEEHPNIDLYSGAEDFTYFSDAHSSALGSENSPIGGYARLSDSTLIIYKQYADREASIYYRTGKLDEEYDENGQLVDGQAIFPLTAGAIGETAITPYACASFAGDTVMLSKNGLFGIVLANNVVSSERYTRERSRGINERLCAQNLSEAVGAVFENRYYLAVDGVCYVADSRYKHRRNDDIDGSFNYEWWYFDNIPARVWTLIDGELGFGTPDGRVCVFDKEYTDRVQLITQAGDLGYSEKSKRVTYNERLKDRFEVGDSFKILSDGVYSLYLGADAYSVADGRIFVSEKLIGSIYEYTEVYADEVGASGLEVGVKYEIAEVDMGECSFSLMRDGEVISIGRGGFRLHRLISGLDFKIETKDDTSFTFGREGFGDIIISSYNGGALPNEAICKTVHADNVIAKWYSALFDLGTNMAVKTILGMTVALEPKYGGKLRFGFNAKHGMGEYAAKGVGSFSFDNLSFEELSFDTAFMSSYTLRLNKRNVNYVMFRFISDDDKGCAVNGMSVLYKINKNSRGVI